MDKNEKKQLLEKYKVKSPIIKDFALAYLFGGGICMMGELIKRGLIYLGASAENAGTLTTIIMIFIASALTGLGVFDVIAKRASISSRARSHLAIFLLIQ